MSQPFITAVIPTYSRPQFLRRAISSVLAQSLDKLRVAVYDNASPDETRSIVSDLIHRDGRITYERHGTNIGAAANYNYGLSRVTTPYFSLLGDDDVLLPGFYEEAVATLERNPSCQFFCARTVIDHRKAGSLMRRGSWESGVYAPSAETVQRMIRDHFINTSVVFRTAVLQTLGYYDSFGSDRNYVVRAAARYAFATTERIGSVMTIHETSFSGGGASTDFGNGSPQVWGGSYVLDSYEQLVSDLSNAGWDRERLDIVMEVLAEQTFSELLYLCATSRDASEWTTSLFQANAAGTRLRTSAKDRVALTILLRLSKWRPLGFVLYGLAKSAWLLSARLRGALWDSAPIRTFLDDLESECRKER